jgi:hypothetical protein
VTARQRANISGWIREHSSEKLRLDETTLKRLALLSTPSVAERADKLLLELERRTEALGLPVEIRSTAYAGDNDPSWLAVCWALDENEVGFLVHDYLVEKGYCESPGGPSHFKTLTAAGYAHLDALRQVNRDSEIGFCAMWFDPSVEPLWTYAIEPAIGDAGYRPVRIDKVEHNEDINDEMIAKIRRARFVVADFTQQRPNVYFEAGFARGMGLNVIWMCREGEQPHFDVRQFNLINWRDGEYKEACRRLYNRIEATLGHGNYRPG